MSRRHPRDVAALDQLRAALAHAREPTTADGLASRARMTLASDLRPLAARPAMDFSQRAYRELVRLERLGLAERDRSSTPHRWSPTRKLRLLERAAAVDMVGWVSLPLVDRNAPRR